MGQIWRARHVVEITAGPPVRRRVLGVVISVVVPRSLWYSMRVPASCSLVGCLLALLLLAGLDPFPRSRHLPGSPGGVPLGAAGAAPGCPRIARGPGASPKGGSGGGQVPGRSATSPQPMFRGGPGRLGRTAFPIPRRRPKIAWRYGTGRPIFGSPAVDAEGSVYVGSLDGNLYRLSRDGALRWKRFLNGRVFSSPAISEPGVAVGSDGDTLFMLDPRTGGKRWTFSLGPCDKGPGFGPDQVRCNADSSVAVGSDGTLYFGGDALYALRSDGRLKWRFDWGGHALSSPAVAPDGTVYVGADGGSVYAVTADGKRRWQAKAPYDFDSTPAVAPDGTVVIGCDDGRLYALQSSDGSVRWTYRTDGPIKSSAAVGADGTIYFGSDDRSLRAVDASGKLKWAHATRGPVRSSPVVDPSGTVVVGSQDDHLYALTAGGQLLWTVELGGDVDSSVAVGPGGVLFVGADDGMLYALR